MLRQGRRLVLVSLALGLLAAPPAAHAASVPTKAKADAALDSALAKVVRATDGPPGAAALIQRGSATRFITEGVADLRSGRRFTA